MPEIQLDTCDAKRRHRRRRTLEQGAYAAKHGTRAVSFPDDAFRALTDSCQIRLVRPKAAQTVIGVRHDAAKGWLMRQPAMPVDFSYPLVRFGARQWYR
jgi:hypothetical protein